MLIFSIFNKNGVMIGAQKGVSVEYFFPNSLAKWGGWGSGRVGF